MTDKPEEKKSDSLAEDQNLYMADFKKELEEAEKSFIEQTEKSFFIFKNWEKAAKAEEDNNNHLNASFLYKKMGDTKKADLFIKKAAEDFDRQGVYLKAAYLYEKTGELDKAAKILDTWYSCNRGESYYLTNTKDMDVYLQKIIELYLKLNNKKKVYQLLLFSKQYDKAANLLVKSKLPAKAATLLEKTGSPLKAADLYEQIGQSRKADLLRAEEAYQNNNYLQAARFYRKAKDFIMAAEQFQEGGEWVKAAECYAQNGNYRHAADCYVRNSNFKEAIEMFEFSGEWEGAADILDKIGQYDKAGKYYARAGKFFKSGKVFLKSQDKDLAVKSFQKVTTESEEFLESNVEIAKLFLDNGRADLVISKLEKLVHTKMPPELKNELRYYLARSYETRIMFDQAENTYKHILKDDFHFKDVQKRIAELEVEKQKYNLIKERREDATKRYKILSKVGEGGMGVVYKALDLHLNRTVAIKELHENYLKDTTTFEMFRKEARAIAALSHPNIVKVFDFGQIYEDYFICMEYLDGKDLFSIIQEKGKYTFSIKEIISFATKIAEALSYAHNKGVIHQDIKPHNIILSADNKLTIMDFGIASIVGQKSSVANDTIIGTPSYIAPEQITKKNISHQVDIYSTGVTLFFILAGEVPFKGDNILAQHLHDLPPSILKFRPETPASMVKILEKCLEKNPADRYQSIITIAEELKKINLDRIRVNDGRKADQRQNKHSITRTVSIPAKNSGTIILEDKNLKKSNDKNDQTPANEDADKTTLIKSQKKQPKKKEKTAKIKLNDSSEILNKKSY
jgi:serine/threonine protein kinase